MLTRSFAGWHLCQISLHFQEHSISEYSRPLICSARDEALLFPSKYICSWTRERHDAWIYSLFCDFHRTPPWKPSDWRNWRGNHGRARPPGAFSSRDPEAAFSWAPECPGRALAARRPGSGRSKDATPINRRGGLGRGSWIATAFVCISQMLSKKDEASWNGWIGRGIDEHEDECMNRYKKNQILSFKKVFVKK